MNMSKNMTKPQAMKRDYEHYLGRWSDGLDRKMKQNPALFERFLAMVKVPERRNAVSEMDRALIGVAVVCNVTNSHPERRDAYIRRVLAAGGNRAQILEAMQLGSVLGIHALSVAVPVLVEALEEEGWDLRDIYELDERQQALKAQFTEVRGYWHHTWDPILALDPDMFEAYLGYSMLPADSGTLDVRQRELIYIAIDSVATHLYVPGIKLHVVNALQAGVTMDEILTAIEIASLIGADPLFDAIETLPQPGQD